MSWRFGHVGKWLHIRKLNVVLNFMRSNSGKQLIIIHILPNIARNKGNQAIKFSHLIAYKWEIFFFKNHAENETGRKVPDLPLFVKKDSCEVKASSQHLDTWTLRTRLGYIMKAKFITFQNVDPAICSILIFMKGIRTRFFMKNFSHSIFY